MKGVNEHGLHDPGFSLGVCCCFRGHLKHHRLIGCSNHVAYTLRALPEAVPVLSRKWTIQLLVMLGPHVLLEKLVTGQTSQRPGTMRCNLQRSSDLLATAGQVALCSAMTTIIRS